MFRATMYPSSGADDYVVLSPRVGIVPWLQEGCQNRLAGSVSIEELNTSMDHTSEEVLGSYTEWVQNLSVNESYWNANGV